MKYALEAFAEKAEVEAQGKEEQLMECIVKAYNTWVREQEDVPSQELAQEFEENHRERLQVEPDKAYTARGTPTINVSKKYGRKCIGHEKTGERLTTNVKITKAEHEHKMASMGSTDTYVAPKTVEDLLNDGGGTITEPEDHPLLRLNPLSDIIPPLEYEPHDDYVRMCDSLSKQLSEAVKKLLLPSSHEQTIKGQLEYLKERNVQITRTAVPHNS